MKRYDLIYPYEACGFWEMREDADGDYVLYEDCIKAMEGKDKEISTSQRQNEALREISRCLAICKQKEYFKDKNPFLWFFLSIEKVLSDYKEKKDPEK